MHPSERSRFSIRRFEGAFLLVSAALGFTLLLRLWFPVPYWLPFLVACTASAWMGGRIAGWTAVICSTLACDYFFNEPLYSLAVNREEMPEFIAFTVSMIAGNWFGTWRLDSELAMRRQQEELTQRVEADGIRLEQAKAALRAEISQRELAEHERGITELRWRAVFDNAVVGMAMIDSQHLVMSANPRFLALVGATAADFKAQRITFYFSDFDSVRLDAALAALMRGTQARVELELPRWTDPPAPCYLRVHIVTVPGSLTFERFFILFCDDITEAKRSEEALQSLRNELVQASRLTTVGELTASIAHELNQPLSAVATNSNACKRWLAGGHDHIDEARATMDWIIRDVERASEVVARIRGLIRKDDERWEAIDFNQIVREGLELLQGDLRRRKIVVRAQLSASLPSIRGVRMQLQQVFLNLAINALEAMSTGKPLHDPLRQLTIKSSPSTGNGTGIVVEIRDTGPGIAEESLEKLFTAFHTTKVDGTGLGLWISQSIVEHHSGTLRAIRDPDQGMIFLIEIPGEEMPVDDRQSIAGEDFLE